MIASDGAVAENTITIGTTRRRAAATPASNLTLGDRWLLFSTTKRGRTMIARANDPRWALGFLMCMFLLYSFSDFIVMEGAEPYTTSSMCQHPLVPFKYSTLRGNQKTPAIELNDAGFRSLDGILATSACYLEKYAQNVSCITPVAYGVEARVISFRKAGGEIVHLVNPGPVSREEGMERIAEWSTLFPGTPRVSVRRPRTLYIDHVNAHLNGTVTSHLELAEAFCVKASLDVFERTMPQM